MHAKFFMEESTKKLENLLLDQPDGTLVGGESKTASGIVESVEVRDARQRRRSLLKLIQNCNEKLDEFTCESDILKFEEETVKRLDWDVRDFLKSARELEDDPANLGDRVGGDFEALVVKCKSRAEELAKNRSKPPSIQLGKSSRSISKSIPSASEIIDEELELIQLQADAAVADIERKAKAKADAEAAKAKAEADAEVARAKDEAEILKKQARIKAKRLKLESMGTSVSSSKSGSRKSGRKSLVSSIVEDIDRKLAIGPLESCLGGPFFKAGRPGSSLGAAVTSVPQSAIKQEATCSGLVSGAAEVLAAKNKDFVRELIPGSKQWSDDQTKAYFTEPVNQKATVSYLTKPYADPQTKMNVDIASDHSRDYPNVSCPPGFQVINPATICSGTLRDGHGNFYQRHPQVEQETDRGHTQCARDSSRKDYLDEAVLIGYDGTNMPYVMFYNQIKNLMTRCPYPDRKLPILRAACVRAAAQTIAVVISDTPGFEDETKISMGLSRLEQRFGRSGGFVNEPEVQQIRNGPKLSSTSGSAWKIFKDELTQCYVFAHSYKKPEVLEGRLVIDLARRLPSYAKQRFLDYLEDRFGSTNEPSFASLMAFVEREEKCKSSDFAVQLMVEEKSERGVKSGSSKSNGYPSMKVKKTAAQFEGNDGQMCRGSEQPAIVPPQCFVCKLEKCDSRHRVVDCRKFKAMSPYERKEVVFKARRCFNCLGGHLLKDCNERCNCRRCERSDVGRHFYMLHDSFVANISRSPRSPVSVDKNRSKSENSNGIENASYSVRSMKLGPTKAALNRIVAARVINPQNGKGTLVYCQLDGGSQLTLISDKLVKELELESYEQTSFRMETLTGNKLTHAELVKFDLQSLFSEEVFALSHVVTNKPWKDDIDTLPHKQDMSYYSHFEGVEMFELQDRTSVDLLIGNDNAFLMTVLEERVGVSRCDPHAILTPLGWLACGGVSPLEKESVKIRPVKAGVDLSIGSPLSQELASRDERIRELEAALRDVNLQDMKVDRSRGDKEAKQFVEAHTVVKDSRFNIPIPVKSGVEELPNNLELAQKRLDSLRKKALKDEKLRVFLSESFCELQDLNYIEPVDDSKDVECLVWYLPYFVTSQAKKRIVYDGSADLNGVCVNDFIETGPDLLNSLADILARFRLGKFGMMADLTKCFFQIGLPESQRDLFRILWFENNDVNEGKIVKFRFTRHPWGVKSSPFIASFAIQKTLEDNATGASDLTRRTIRKNIYMDDIIFGVDSLEEARTIAYEAIELFDSRGFKLVKWSANRDTLSVLAELDKEVLVSSMRDLDLSIEQGNDLPDAKTLGCVWETGEDRLRIVSSLTPLSKYTRRAMLSQLGKSFDPLGIFSPFFVKARLILQRLAIEKYGWDDVVSESIVKEWKAWFQLLDSLLNISVARYYFEGSIPASPQDRVIYQLHSFSDASNKAYGSVIYLRRIVNRVATVSIVFGRSKVVLRHQESWPIARKELVAAVNTVELSKKAYEALELTNCKQYFWSDSRNVLQWIHNKELRLDRFISRRIEKILLLSEPESWRYCPTSLNPADVASRPDGVKKLEARELWFGGPEFLKKVKEVPTCECPGVSVNRVAYPKKNRDLCVPEEAPLDKVIESAPSLYALTKRVAYLSAFIEYLRCKVKNQEFERPKFDTGDLNRALNKVVGFVQQKYYGQALSLLQSGSPEELSEAVDRCSKRISDQDRHWIKELRGLNRFRPCLDVEGLLRVEGRLSNSPELTEDMKHPLILPSKCALTRLVVLQFHVDSSHVGVQHTLLCTRKKFWIVNGHASVKRYLSECGQCLLEKAKPVRQLMADLPVARTAVCHKAFSTCGLDYFGHLNYVEGRSIKKAWGLLFTCMASRAVHVEVVTSLGLKEFLMAFSRFNDVRGNVETIYSDNGSTFQAASKVLPDLVKSPKLKNALRKKGINWEFIPPYAPSQGGSWESMVKQIKRILQRTLDPAAHTPSLIELITFCSNAVRVVNERPITALSEDPRDCTVVTPASLLTPGFHPYSPVGSVHERDHLRRDYKFCVALAERFWKDWMAFYLPTLQGRNKWRESAQNLQVGDLVLVGDAEDISKRGNYRVGRISEIFPQMHHGKPIVRRAKVAVTVYDSKSDSYAIDHILRDISRIAPVELG